MWPLWGREGATWAREPSGINYTMHCADHAVHALCTTLGMHRPEPALQSMPYHMWVECGSRVAAMGLFRFNMNGSHSSLNGSLVRSFTPFVHSRPPCPFVHPVPFTGCERMNRSHTVHTQRPVHCLRNRRRARCPGGDRRIGWPAEPVESAEFGAEWWCGAGDAATTTWSSISMLDD